MALPNDAKERKALPVATGVIDYFPDAIMEVAKCSFTGNEQHNPGTPLHWDRSKSGDEGDALLRHFIDRGKIDNDGIRHSAKMAWRALALLQKEMEAASRPKVDTSSPRHYITPTTDVEFNNPGEFRETSYNCKCKR